MSGLGAVVRKTSDEERRLIDEALAQGRVTVCRSPTSSGHEPANRVERLPSEHHGASAPSRPPLPASPSRMSVQHALEWAFRVERAQVEFPRQDDPHLGLGFGFGMEHVMIERAKLGGVRIDRSRGRSSPHADAEIIADEVARLPDRLGGRRQALKIAECARSGMAPDWMPEAQPRLVPARDSARGRAVVETIETVRVRVNGKVRPRAVQWCPCTWAPDFAQIASARANYRDWWFALSHLRRALKANNLLSLVKVTDAMPPLQPWGQDLERPETRAAPRPEPWTHRSMHPCHRTPEYRRALTGGPSCV